MTRLFLLALVTASVVGCSTNHSFKRAESPDGVYDHLVTDLADQPQLHESVGVPFLLDWRVTNFRRETSREQFASSLARTQLFWGQRNTSPATSCPRHET